MAAIRDEVSLGDVGNVLKIKIAMKAAYSGRGWLRKPRERQQTLAVGLPEWETETQS